MASSPIRGGYASIRTARRRFRDRQGLPKPSTDSAKRGGTRAEAGEATDARPIVMTRPHMQDIPQTPLPPAHTMRGMSVDTIGLWTDIQRDAEEYFEIKSSLFMNQFGDGLPSIGHRCFILSDPEGRGVGTISAWYNRDFRGKDWGRIHRVALRP